MTPTIEWAEADYFREIGKVLGVEPELIMAAYGGDPPTQLVTVLYTPSQAEEDPPVWCAQLWREDSGLKVERRQDTGRRFSSFLPADDIEARLRSDGDA